MVESLTCYSFDCLASPILVVVESPTSLTVSPGHKSHYGRLAYLLAGQQCAGGSTHTFVQGLSLLKQLDVAIIGHFSGVFLKTNKQQQTFIYIYISDINMQCFIIDFLKK